MRFLAALLLFAGVALAQTQTPPQPQQMGPPAAPPQVLVPSTPANSPAQPPQVSYQNGLLSIRAENSTLADVLNQVKAQTGAQIDVPPGATTERLYITDGPAPLRAALVTLLSGSGFDYIILGNPQDPQGVQRVLLTPHATEARAAAPAGFNPQPQPRGTPVREDDEDRQNTSEQPTMPIPGTPMVQPGMQPNQPVPQPGQSPDANGIKTPDQLLQELQQIQKGSQTVGPNGQPLPNPNQQIGPNGQPIPPRRVPINPPH